MCELLGICLSLVGLLSINSLVSLLVSVLWRRISPAAESWSTSTRAQLLFFLRIAPGLVAILCVGAVFIPAYVVNEPRHTSEIVTAKLGLLTAVSLYGIGLALWRRFAACLATHRLVGDWLKHAEPIQIENVPIPAFRFQHRFPVIAVLGATRPRLFIADQIFHSLSAEEIAAAVAHEKGHLIAVDNFKRGLLRMCRDFLTVIPAGRSLDRAWVEAAELAADDYAARGGASAALDLASALVKVARLAPIGSKPAMFAGASLISEDPGRITSRVLRLTQLAARPSTQRAETRILRLVMGACLSGFLTVVVLTVSSSGLLATIHSALEYVVSALQ
jgi:hypothetical protein